MKNPEPIKVEVSTTTRKVTIVETKLNRWIFNEEVKAIGQ
jgi:hypothetical protein